MEQNVSKKKAWYIVFISSLMGCSIAMAFPQFSMTIETLTQKTGLSQEFLLTSDTVKAGAIVLSMLCSGFLYKKMGAKPLFVVSLTLTSLPQFLLPFASSEISVLWLKAMQGFSSIIFPVFILIILDVISNEKAGLATAIFNGIFYSGGGIGGTLAGFFIVKHGWISSYFAIGIIQITIGILWLITVKGISAKPSKHCQLKDRDKDRKENIGIREIAKNPTTWLLALAFIATTFVVQAITVDVPIYSKWLGYGEMDTGKIATAVTIGLLVSCLVSGKVSDVLANKMRNTAKARVAALAIGYIIVVIGALVLILANLNNFGTFYFVVLLFSFGGSWGLGTFYAILPELYKHNQIPMATGFAGGMGNLGMPAAPFMVGVIFGAKGLWGLGWASCIIFAVISLAACAILFCRTKKH